MKNCTVIFKFDVGHEFTAYAIATSDPDAIRDAFASYAYGKNYGPGTAIVFCENSNIGIKYVICTM